MILPKNYEKIYHCVNECGSTAKIYANEDYTKAYKIYKKVFRYNQQKFEEFKSFSNPSFFTPIDMLSFYENPDYYVGYEMDFDNGVSLPKIKDGYLLEFIKASLYVSKNLSELTKHHFLIVDPNSDNITFSDSFKFVDTYSFRLMKDFNKDLLFKRNMMRVNDMVMSGLIDMHYKQLIELYLRKIKSKYLESFLKLTKDNPDNEMYIYDCLSILLDATQEEQLQVVKQKIKV